MRPLTGAGAGLGLRRSPSRASTASRDDDGDSGSTASGSGTAVAVVPRYETTHWNYPYKSWAAVEGLAMPVVVRKVSAGNAHTLVLTASGEAWSFGSGER
jgi:hypothetical protein